MKRVSQEAKGCVKQSGFFPETSLFTNLDRQLNDLPTEEPQETGTKCTVRWDLLVEIEFLINFGLPGDVILYPYPIDQKRRNLLGRLFPDLEFLIYGDSEIFTDRTAQQLRRKNKRYLLIGTPGEDLLARLAELRVWAEILNPDISLIRFMKEELSSLDADGIHYLPGILIPADSELYLWVHQRGSHRYSLDDLRGLSFHHQIRARTTEYELIEGVSVDEIKCHCYNCSAELFIWGQYRRKYCPDKRVQDLKSLLSM